MPTARHHIPIGLQGRTWCVACNQPVQARWAEQELCPASIIDHRPAAPQTADAAAGPR